MIKNFKSHECLITFRIILLTKKSYLQMQPGTFELLILVFIFLGLQAWWIIPIVIKNNKLNNRGKDLREEIKQLEKLYKK